ncbi:protein translocase SEC61 complex subunit gamma [Candidatus Pacearchaeota archaeon CG10_big_fil_rev_8_21_14_0_10_32_14]|nr:MAG: protein translocase SEC61 complex subunit gamma [Candidatus Pacearchaeota archaeon CG10_big_fil_rev_8_21_14_0_10_32_14]
MENEKVPFTTRSKSFFIQCKRVWHILRKPSKKEFETTAKISAIGILVIGAIGFLIAIIMSYIIK